MLSFLNHHQHIKNYPIMGLIGIIFLLVWDLLVWFWAVVIRRKPHKPLIGSVQTPKYDFVLKVYGNEIRDQLDIDYVGQLIGHGEFGEVYSGFKNLFGSSKFALKVQSSKFSFDKNEWFISVLREITILESDHPNLVQMFDFWFVGNSKHVVIKTEFLDITLREVLLDKRVKDKRLTTVQSLNLAKQLSSVVSWLHQNRIVHHDIKSGNVMLKMQDSGHLEEQAQIDSATFKLIDVGFGITYRNNWAIEREFFDGTYYYMCPDKAANIPYDPYSADDFAVGVTLLQSRMGIDDLSKYRMKYGSFETACHEYAESIKSKDAKAYEYLCLVENLLRFRSNQRASIEYFAGMIQNL